MSNFGVTPITKATGLPVGFYSNGPKTKNSTYIKELVTSVPDIVTFTPNILGCALWLDANDSTTITKDVDNKVSSWNDKSGSLRHFIQSNTGNKPSYTASAQNSKAVIGYTASSLQYMIGNTTANNFAVETNSFAYFVVCKLTNNGGVFNKSVFGSTSGRILCVKDTGSLLLQLTHNNTDGSIPSISDSYTVTNYRILSIVCNRTAGNDKAYQNGSLVGTTYTYASDTGTNLTNSNTFILGAYNNATGGANPPNGYYLEGAIAEVLMYSSTTDMTDIDRQKIEGYLAWKWGLQGNLPANHNHKVQAP